MGMMRAVDLTSARNRACMPRVQASYAFVRRLWQLLLSAGAESRFPHRLLRMRATRQATSSVVTTMDGSSWLHWPFLFWRLTLLCSEDFEVSRGTTRLLSEAMRIGSLGTTMLSDALHSFTSALSVLGIALFATLAVELPIAAAFRIGRRALGVVVLINVVTNPAFNLLFAVLADFVGFPPILTPTLIVLGWSAIFVLEIIVAVVEWRLMVWAFQGTTRSSRELLVLSIIMNACSAVFGTALAYLLAFFMI